MCGQIVWEYLGLRPTHDPKCLHNLYLYPLKGYSEHVWYSCQLLGQNTLQKVTSKLANLANLEGRCTNYSLCATGPTRLYTKGVDEKLVCELIGHCSNAVLEYKHTSPELKQHVSEVLYGNQTGHVPSESTPSCFQSQPDLAKKTSECGDFVSRETDNIVTDTKWIVFHCADRVDAQF